MAVVVCVINEKTGERVANAKVSVIQSGLFGGVHGPERTDSDGIAEFPNASGLVEIVVNGRKRKKGQLSGLQRVFV